MKQRACPVAGARANNEQRPMECSGARSAGGEHPWSQLCFIKRQRSRESQRTLTCVPPQSCPRRSQDVAFGCAHSPYCGRWARRIADGVDGRRRRRRGTPFATGEKCRFFRDRAVGSAPVLEKCRFFPGWLVSTYSPFGLRPSCDLAILPSCRLPCGRRRRARRASWAQTRPC